MMTPPRPTSVSRLVIRPPNWLGDALLALPAMSALRAQFPNAHLVVAATPVVAALFREETAVKPDALIEITVKSREIVAALRAGHFDLGVLFPNSFHSAWQLRQARVPERWGYGTSARGWLLTQRSSHVRTDGVQHQADYYRALVRGLGIACDDRLPRLSVSPQSAAQARALLAQAGSDRPLIGFAPGAAYGQAKQWPPDRVAEVAARLVRDRDATCVVLGAAHDRAASRAIESWLRVNAPEAAGRVIDLVGRTSLGTLAGVLSRCDVVTSNDSGAMHLAAALGRPVVAIFGPTDERATRPLGTHEIVSEAVFCRPCLLRDCPIDHRCMKRVSVDRVHAAVTRLLAMSSGSGR
jgi:heptosyltransferase II